VDWAAPAATWFPGLTLPELQGLVTKVPEERGQLHYLMPRRREIEESLVALDNT
jgi:hypothetical protein